MSKKFLSEAQVRRFQALANVPAVNEMGMDYHGDRDEDEMPGEEYPEGDIDAEMGEELPGDEGPEDAGLDMEVSDEGGELDLSPEQKESLAADIVRAVAQELEGALQLDEPIEVDVEADPALDAEMDMEMDLEEPLEGGEEDLEMGAEEELEEPLQETSEENLEESEEELAEVVDDEAVVNEVLRRVVARLTSK